jgi:hypothetical protein
VLTDATIAWPLIVRAVSDRLAHDRRLNNGNGSRRSGR